MKNKRVYTDKDFEKKLPEPGTPVDEAWKQMHELLVKNNLTVREKKGKRRTILLVLLLLFISISGIIGYRLKLHDQAVKLTASDSSNNKIPKQNNTAENLSADTTREHIQQDTLSSVLQGDNKKFHSRKITANNNLRIPVTNDNTSTGKNITDENKSNPVNEEANHDQLTDAKKNNKNDIENEVPSASETFQNKKEDTVQIINHSVENKQPVLVKNKADKNSKQVKFHYGLQWNINFSLKNNSNYFDAYNGGNQYYMWALPAAWVKMDINKKQGITFRLTPLSQQFAGKQVVNIEKPFIASVEPDSVTRLLKSRGFNFGLNYEYAINSKITLVAGFSYSIHQNALYLKQAIEGYSGNVLSENIYAAQKRDASFKYLNPSYISWNGSVKYNFSKFSIGAGVTRPITNLSSNSEYNVRPLNGEFYLQYHFK